MFASLNSDYQLTFVALNWIQGLAQRDGTTEVVAGSLRGYYEGKVRRWRGAVWGVAASGLQGVAGLNGAVGRAPAVSAARAWGCTVGKSDKEEEEACVLLRRVWRQRRRRR